MSELDDQIAALGDEHPPHEAESWLLARPELSRPALLGLVARPGPDPATRRAVRLLGRLGDPADVPLLAGLLGTGLTWEAAQALVLHAADDAAAALRRATEGGEPEAVAAAASALGERREEAGRAALEALLDDPREEIRHRAVHALGRLGAGRSASALRAAAARDPSAAVRRLIAEELRRTAEEDLGG